MTGWNWCIILSIPLYAALNSRLRGRAKEAAFWAYFWALAGVMSVGAWRFYTTWHRLAALVPADPARDATMRHVLWFNLAEIAILLGTPVALYLRQRRSARLQGVIPVMAEAGVWPPPPVAPP